MGIDPVTLAIASIAVSGIGSAMQMVGAGYAADAEIRAANEQFALVDYEASRQQREAGLAAEREKSVRIAQADRELATLRVISGERGASADSAARLAGAVGLYEGMDLATIVANRDAYMEAGQASKRAGSLAAMNAVTSASMKRKATVMGSALDFAGSGLQIGADYYKTQTANTALKNKA